MLAWATGIAIAYILVQNMRYTLDQVARDTDSLGKLISSASKEGEVVHEAIESSSGTAGVVVNVWDVLTGQQTPGEAGKDFVQGEIERGKKITGWLGL